MILYEVSWKKLNLDLVLNMHYHACKPYLGQKLTGSGKVFGLSELDHGPNLHIYLEPIYSKKKQFVH